MRPATGISSRRHLLAGLGLAAALAALQLPAVGAAAGGVADGRDAAPLVVSIAGPVPAHWLPGRRHRAVHARSLRTATTPTPRTTAVLAIAPAPTAEAPSAPVAAVPPAVSPTVATPNAAAPNVAAPNLAAEHASSYTFMSEPTPGDPIRWDPCGTVHWVFNPANAPAGGLDTVQSAVSRISAATGLHFAYDGTSAATPTGAYLDAQTGATGFQPVLIGWSTPAASTLLANQPANLVGMDQTIWAQPASGATHIVSGVIALSATVNAGTSGANSWYTFALHELGHAVGLGHTTDDTQIMAPVIPAAATDYGSGDLSGLAKVGGTC